MFVVVITQGLAIMWTLFTPSARLVILWSFILFRQSAGQCFANFFCNPTACLSMSFCTAISPSNDQCVVQSNGYGYKSPDQTITYPSVYTEVKKNAGEDCGFNEGCTVHIGGTDPQYQCQQCTICGWDCMGVTADCTNLPNVVVNTSV